MDLTLLIKAAIMGVVEGLTEFLPISSTGHLILAGALLDFNDERGKLFEIVIQSAAILAVVWEFRARIKGTLAGVGRDPRANRLLLNVAIAFMPVAVLGLAVHADQLTLPLHQVPSTTRPKAMRYQAKGAKLWVAM